MSGDHNANQKPIKTYHALPLALRLADELDGGVAWVGNADDSCVAYKTAAELRRLHAENEALRGFAEEVRRTGDTRLASMAIATLAQGQKT